MFDIGFSELFVIAIVALIVLGPERLPKATRFVGLWVRRGRAQWYSVKSELETELADDELKRSLLQTRDQLHSELRQARDGLQRTGASLRGEFSPSAGSGDRLIEPPAPAPMTDPQQIRAVDNATGDETPSALDEQQPGRDGLDSSRHPDHRVDDDARR